MNTKQSPSTVLDGPFIDWALEKNREGLTLYDGRVRPNNWDDGVQTHSILWTFTLHIKRMAEAEGLGQKEAWQRIKEDRAGKGWPEEIVRVANRKGWGLDGLEDEFYGNWDCIHHTPLKAILGMVERKVNAPKIPTFQPKGDRSSGYFSRFLPLIIELARLNQGGEFFISRKLTKEVKINPKAISNGIRWALADGILLQTNKASPGIRCARFRLAPWFSKQLLERKPSEPEPTPEEKPKAMMEEDEAPEPRKKPQPQKTGEESGTTDIPFFNDDWDDAEGERKPLFNPENLNAQQETPKLVNGVLYLPGE